MRPPPEINVQMFGHKFLRFVLTNAQGHFWTGDGWSSRSGKALLYYHLELVQGDRRKLRKQRRRKQQ